MVKTVMKKCVLEEKECIDCGQCDDRCQLDPQKICDNCFRCLDAGIGAQPYAEIPIAGVYGEDDFLPDTGEMHVEQRQYCHIQTLQGLCGRYRKL